MLAEIWNAVTSVAFRDIEAERRRQVETEGWTFGHDDGYVRGEMARAAFCYVLRAMTGPERCAEDTPPLAWPWDRSWWKPTTVRRMLVKAAALLIAEIERIDRKETARG